MEILRKDLKKMQGIENMIKEMKNAFDELTSTPDTAEERISEFEDVSVEASKMEKQIEKRLEKVTEPNIQELWDYYKRCNIHIMGIPEREEREKGKEIFETMVTDNFLQINVGHQITDPGSSENTMQDKCQKTI